MRALIKSIPRGLEVCVKALIKKEVKVSIEGLGEITAPIAFIDHIASDMALLARQGFFEAFEITFREWERKLVVGLREV